MLRREAQERNPSVSHTLRAFVSFEADRTRAGRRVMCRRRSIRTSGDACCARGLEAFWNVDDPTLHGFRRSSRGMRRRSGGPSRRSMTSCSPRVMGHSPPHARQHQASCTTPPAIVVSGARLPCAPHNLQPAGTLNRTGVVGTRGSVAFGIPERGLLQEARMRVRLINKLAQMIDGIDLRATPLVAEQDPRLRLG